MLLAGPCANKCERESQALQRAAQHRAQQCPAVCPVSASAGASCQSRSGGPPGGGLPRRGVGNWSPPAPSADSGTTTAQ